MKIISPKTQEELKDYFQLRWLILREPWGQVKGSEKDEFEDESHHISVSINKNIVGVGRIHLASKTAGQIRYMAVMDSFRNKGIGKVILQELEVYAEKNKLDYIELNARDTAIGFYEKHGYDITGDGHVLFDEIKHVIMRKSLQI